MIREAMQNIEEKWTNPLSDVSNANTFLAKQRKIDKDSASFIGDKESGTEMFVLDRTLYQRMDKKYYSQTFTDNDAATSYLRNIS